MLKNNISILIISLTCFVSIARADMDCSVTSYAQGVGTVGEKGIGKMVDLKIAGVTFRANHSDSGRISMWAYDSAGITIAGFDGTVAENKSLQLTVFGGSKEPSMVRMLCFKR